MKLLKLLFVVCVIGLAKGITLYKPNNMLSENRIIFNSNTSSLSYKNYVIIYSQDFNNTPTINYGVSHYHTGSRFYYQNLQTFISATHKDHFVLDINPIQITVIYKLSVCFLAIDDAVNFVAVSKSFLNPIVYSGHKGDRSVTLRPSFNFSHPNARGTLSITGFYVQSVGQFEVSSEITSIGTQSFTVVISTSSDCSINRLDLSFLFFYASLNTNEYLMVINNYYCFRNISSATTYTLVSSVDISVFYFGMTGFGGVTAKSYVDVGWSSTAAASNNLNINVTTANVFYLCFSFIQIYTQKSYIPTPSLSPLPTNITNATSPANTTTNTTHPASNATNTTVPSTPPTPTGIPVSEDSQGNSTLLTIIVAIVGAVIALLATICLIRRYYLSKYYEKRTIADSKKQLSIMSIKELPTINF